MIHSAPFCPAAPCLSGVAPHRAPRRALHMACLFLACSLYSSAGSVELPVDNLVFQVQQAARELLARQAATSGLLEPLYEINVVKTTRPIEACAQPVAVTPLDTRQANRLRFVAVCPGAAGWRYEFVARATISARVAVVARAVAAGTPLAEADLALERRDISMIGDSLWDARQVAGMAAKRSLRAGELLRQSLLVLPSLVKRGDQVRIVARRDQVEVSMAGEALEAGALAALVRVRNVSSGNIIRARVTAAGTVEPADLAP